MSIDYTRAHECGSQSRSITYQFVRQPTVVQSTTARYPETYHLHNSVHCIHQQTSL
jgi:hypothetical protein